MAHVDADQRLVRVTRPYVSLWVQMASAVVCQRTSIVMVNLNLEIVIGLSPYRKLIRSY